MLQAAKLRTARGRSPAYWLALSVTVALGATPCVRAEVPNTRAPRPTAQAIHVAVKPPAFGAPATAFNVKNFGAVCDGSTDDTAAIQSAYTAAAAAMDKQGGAGIVYFPPSSGFCKVSTLHVPSMGYPQGWLYSLFDEGLLVTNTIYPGSNNAFIGRTSNFLAMGNVFLWGPSAEWQKPKDPASTTAPLVELAGVKQVYFEGIAFGDSTSLAPEVVEVSDGDGILTTNLNFRNCSFMGGFDVSPSQPSQEVGFGLHFVDCSMGTVSLQNFLMVTIRGGYVNKITMSNAGIPSDGNLEVSDVLSENLNKTDFLTVDTSGGGLSDIILRRVGLADTVGAVYMLKHVHHADVNWLVNVKFDMIPTGSTGTGLIDPASAPQLLSVICEGAGCENILGQAQPTLYMFVGMPPKGPMIVYGSQYVSAPLVVTH